MVRSIINVNDASGVCKAFEILEAAPELQIVRIESLNIYSLHQNVILNINYNNVIIAEIQIRHG